jgi:hypothetical protein
MYGGCTSQDQSSCNFDRYSKAFCGFTSTLNITESYYIYYGSPKTGGFVYFLQIFLFSYIFLKDGLADYCPFYVSYSNGICSDPDNLLTKDHGELFEEQSRCFDGTLSKDENSAQKDLVTSYFIEKSH